MSRAEVKLLREKSKRPEALASGLFVTAAAGQLGEAIVAVVAMADAQQAALDVSAARDQSEAERPAACCRNRDSVPDLRWVRKDAREANGRAPNIAD